MSDRQPADPEGFAVLVFDMAHTGQSDGERVVEGFASLSQARAYAEARIRDSVEALREPGQADADLRRLWFMYGEDCKVIGDAGGRTDIDLYIAVPASTSERDWVALTPRLRRFHAIISVANANGDLVLAGGFIRRYLAPTRQALLRIFSADARDAFARQGFASSVPVDATVAHLFELPDVPEPPIGKGPMLRWRIAVDFVCHDVKFGAAPSGVFEWPQEPERSTRDAMIRVLVADMLAIRGDGPDLVDYCDILRSEVTETRDEADYPWLVEETPFSD